MLRTGRACCILQPQKSVKQTKNILRKTYVANKKEIFLAVLRPLRFELVKGQPQFPLCGLKQSHKCVLANVTNTTRNRENVCIYIV